jgi:hypothetical protein
MCGGGGNDSAREIEKQNLLREQNVNIGMKKIDSVFSQFNPAFYDKVRSAHKDVLLPQVGRQYRQTRKGLVSTMAERGILKSSAAKEASTDLETDRSMAEMAVSSQADDAVRSKMEEVQRTKMNITNSLVASQNPTVAAQQAVSSAAMISAPSMVAPVGNMFQSFANIYLAQQVGKQYGGGSTVESSSTPSFGDRTSKNYFK